MGNGWFSLTVRGIKYVIFEIQDKNYMMIFPSHHQEAKPTQNPVGGGFYCFDFLLLLASVLRHNRAGDVVGRKLNATGGCYRSGTSSIMGLEEAVAVAVAGT
jgi:hypothetical protein